MCAQSCPLTHALTISFLKGNVYIGTVFSLPLDRLVPREMKGYFTHHRVVTSTPTWPYPIPPLTAHSDLSCVRVCDIKNSTAGHASCDAASST